MEFDIIDYSNCAIRFGDSDNIECQWYWMCQNHCDFWDDTQLATRLLKYKVTTEQLQTTFQNTFVCVCCVKIATIQERKDVLAILIPRLFQQHQKQLQHQQRGDVDVDDDDDDDIKSIGKMPSTVPGYLWNWNLPHRKSSINTSTATSTSVSSTATTTTTITTTTITKTTITSNITYPKTQMQLNKEICNLIAMCIYMTNSDLCSCWLTSKINMNDVFQNLKKYLKLWMCADQVRFIHSIFAMDLNIIDKLLHLFADYCQMMPSMISRNSVSHFQSLMSAIFYHVSRWRNDIIYKNCLNECATFLCNYPQYIHLEMRNRYFVCRRFCSPPFQRLQDQFETLKRHQTSSNFFTLETVFHLKHHPLFDIHLFPLIFSFVSSSTKTNLKRKLNDCDPNPKPTKIAHVHE